MGKSDYARAVERGAIVSDGQVNHWEETIYDLEQEIIRLKREKEDLRKVLVAASPIADMRHEILETIIEAAGHRFTDEARLKRLNAVLEGVFKAVLEWRKLYQSEVQS